MMTHGGYAGRAIRIDLTNKHVSEYPWSDQDRQQYVGGKAMAARILLDHLTGEETAFSEENWIVITTGPLTGTGAPGSARFDIAALSPRDDLPAFSNCGGNFGIRLKEAGYDALILTGRCPSECWLEIHRDRVVFHDAGELRGTGTGQCREKLARYLGSHDAGTLCIGPAGENLVKFASVISDGHTAGRAGIGAVLGWKRLKAIAVSGTKDLPLHAPEDVEAWNREWYAYFKTRVQSTDAAGGSFCGDCPLHCPRHSKDASQALLNELGLDAIAAKDALSWARAQGMPTEGLYETIALRTGPGDPLAEGVQSGGKKGGKRRSSSRHLIAQAFGLPADAPETARFCSALTELISIAGQCMFTLHALPKEDPMGRFCRLLSCVTGRKTDLKTLIAIGQRSLDMEQALRQRFQ